MTYYNYHLVIQTSLLSHIVNYNSRACLGPDKLLIFIILERKKKHKQNLVLLKHSHPFLIKSKRWKLVPNSRRIIKAYVVFVWSWN